MPDDDPRLGGREDGDGTGVDRSEEPGMGDARQRTATREQARFSSGPSGSVSLPPLFFINRQGFCKRMLANSIGMGWASRT